MKVKVKRRILIVFIILTALGGMTLLKNMKPEPAIKPVKDTTMLIEVLELNTAEVTFKIKSQGTVKPRTRTILSAEVSGQITKISEKFIAGGIFKKNEILMQIDPTDYQVAVDQADALLQQRQIEFDGAKSLRSKGYRAEAELASAKASLAAATASLVRATKNLNRTKIRLPYGGLVESKNADIGQYVNLGSKLGTTFAVDRAEVRLPLTDQDLAFLNLPSAGDIVDTGSYQGPIVKLSAIRKGKLQHWDARIIRTEGVVDERSRVTYAVAEITDPYQLSHTQSQSITNTTDRVPLPIGSFVRAVIDGNTFPGVIKIPRSALRGKNEILFIDSDNQLQIRQVDILRADSKFAYISGGVIAGDKISITAIESPINGMKVRTNDDTSLTSSLSKSN